MGRGWGSAASSLLDRTRGGGASSSLHREQLVEIRGTCLGGEMGRTVAARVAETQIPVRGGAVVLSGLLSVLAPVLLPGQATRPCAIEVRPVVLLGANDDTISAFEFPTIANDREGRYFVSPDASRGRVMVFDAKGRLRRLLGRAGDGPGEYRWAESVRALRDGGVYVVDPIAGRLSVYDAGLRLREERRLLRGLHDAWSGPGDSIVGLGFAMGRQSIGLPLHVLASDGTVARSFGNARSATLFTPESEVRAARHAALAPDSTFWLAPFHEYQLEQWSFDGRRISSRVIPSDWFESWFRRPRDREDMARPVTEVAGIHVDNAGLVWVFSSVPENDWRPDAKAMLRRGTETGILDRIQRDRYVDAVIEIVDPRTGVVRAHQRFGRSLLPVRGDEPLAFGWRATDRGGSVPEVFRLTPSCSVPK